jgi:LDH2 family malate/lactate/ureidoglycolate dehydrogenase
MADKVIISAEELAALTEKIFTAGGMNPAHAATVAEVLVWADLRGSPSHGVQRIPRYMEIIDAGEMNKNAAMRIIKEMPGAVLIDADRAPGQVAMTLAAEQATRKAKESGIGLALVRRTTHTAALGFYTRLAALKGMAALAGSASWPNMIYHGAREVGVATNPLAIAVPRRGDEPMIFDMATGVVALGKIVHAARSGEAIPEGWALDAKGNPTTDPNLAVLPLPLGGPKGSGLSLMIECIASLITSNPLIAETLEETEEGKKHRQNAFLIAIDIGAFGTLDLFTANLERTVTNLKALPRQDGVDEILMPGERGARTLAKRWGDGIIIPGATWTSIGVVAARFGIPLPS